MTTCGKLTGDILTVTLTLLETNESTFSLFIQIFLDIPVICGIIARHNCMDNRENTYYDICQKKCIQLKDKKIHVYVK